MKNTLISIIVPVYKVEVYLQTCVDSVINQTYKYWELILVNDGSPDRCPKICDEYASKDKRIKVIHKKNGGVANARNVALDVCKGEYITFLDSDDFFHSEYLQVLLDLCLNHDADISQCGFTRGDAKIFPDLESSNKIEIYDNHSVFLKGKSKIVVWGKLYKSYLFDGLRIPEDVFFEDDYITWKWYYKANGIVISDKILYYYTENIKSVMANHAKKPDISFITAYKERIDFFKIRKEIELKDFSRGHLCKALVLTSNNRNLTTKQKDIVNSVFLENWQKIKYSKNVFFPLRILFLMFLFLPKFTRFLFKIKI